MSFVTSENQPGRRIFASCRLVGAAVSAIFALTVFVGSARAENKIFLLCESESGTVVTNGDMAAASIGEELAALAVDNWANSGYSLVLSYHEGGLSTYSHGGSGSFQHGGLTVVRPVATSSPRFWKALVEGEVWVKCTLLFTRDGPSSENQRYLEIRMDSVMISQIEPRAVAQLEAPDTGRSHLEAITFFPLKITWDDLQGSSYQYVSESGP